MIISSPSPPSAKLQSPSPVLKLSITLSPMLLLRLVGCTSYSWKSMRHPHRSALVYCNNINIVYMSSNSVQHQHTKNIEIDLHFVQERVTLSEACALHVPLSLKFADVFTKGLPSPVFRKFRSSLNVRRAVVPTFGRSLYLVTLMAQG